MEVLNGTGGYYRFPVNPAIAYIIRDNYRCHDVCSLCKTGQRYSLFVITGNGPTIWQHELSCHIMSSDNYSDCCTEIELVTARASKLDVSTH